MSVLLHAASGCSQCVVSGLCRVWGEEGAGLEQWELGCISQLGQVPAQQLPGISPTTPSYQPAEAGDGFPPGHPGHTVPVPCCARLSSQPRCSPGHCRARTSSRCLSQNSLLCVVAVTRAGTRCGWEPTQTQSLHVWAFFRHFRKWQKTIRK